jgi:hypothetical protein
VGFDNESDNKPRVVAFENFNIASEPRVMFGYERDDLIDQDQPELPFLSYENNDRES